MPENLTAYKEFPIKEPKAFKKGPREAGTYRANRPSIPRAQREALQAAIPYEPSKEVRKATIRMYERRRAGRWDGVCDPKNFPVGKCSAIIGWFSREQKS